MIIIESKVIIVKRFNPEKELNKIKNGNKNKIIVGLCTLLLIVVVGYSFALYQVRHTNNLVYTVVKSFSNKDINILAIYVDEKLTNKFPEKNSGYKYDHIVCDNGSTAKFDNIKWKVILEAGNQDKCNIFFSKEDEMPNVPELYQGLIPVVYESDGTVLIADTTTDWYNYADKRWANAVLVDSTNYSKYVKNGEYISNKVIPMTEILQMYVWIPRYKYQLFNVNNEETTAQEIKIRFENGTISTGEATCTIDNIGVETCTNALNGKWFTHPAFKFGNTDLTGIWVGKFETSGNTTNLTIKPNMNSLVNTSVNNMHNASRNIELVNADKYSLNQNIVDTHMMKNMEWGAVAYFSQSKYGRCLEGQCTKITLNGTSYKTGYANSSYQWNTTNGVHATTTDNIYGVYDMAGGALEQVMANMVDVNGNFSPSKSQFTTIPLAKYYDIYPYETTITNINVTHLGDAIREVRSQGSTVQHVYGWNSAYLTAPFTSGPFPMRGGGSWYGDGANIFTVGSPTGEPYANNGFRVVLTAQDGIN